MKKKLIICISIILAVSVVVTGTVVFIKNAGKNEVDITSHLSAFSDTAKMSYSALFYELSDDEKNETDTWRQGMISGNGLQGVITSGAPYSDTLIFQNMHFILPNKNVRYCPNTADELETVRQAIAANENITDDASYDDVYAFHPGGTLRITQTDRLEQNYIR